MLQKTTILRTFFSIFLSAFFSHIASASIVAPCQGNIVLQTQAQVDAFGPCELFVGNIRIEGNDITNLEALIGLKEVDGNIVITSCPLLSDLTGLDSLHSILFFDIHETGITNLQSLLHLQNVTSLHIRNNDSLINLIGLSGLQEISHSLSINGNDNLNSFFGLTTPTDIGAYLNIDNNNNLTDIQNLSYLESLGTLSVSRNPRLKEIAGLDNLSQVRTILKIYGNDSLISIQHLNQLDSIFVHLDINNNPQLPNLDGLNQLKYVDQIVNIYANDELANLDGLEGLNYVGDNFSIRQNPMLNSCCGIYNLLQNGVVGGNTSIYGNPAFCNSPAEILANCIPAPICEGFFNPSTQAEIDAFGPCTIFDGDIVFQPNSPIQNLDAFAGLEEVTGSLIISGQTGLQNIDGLSNLKKVGQTFYLIGLDQITSLAPLQQLDSVGMGFEVADNDILKNLEGLEDLQYIGESFYLLNNDGLETIGGLTSLRSIGSQFVIDDHPLLENIDGLEALESVGLDVFISDNPVLENIDGISGLTSIFTDLNITDNATLSNCCGIYNLIVNNGIGADLLLENNPSLCSTVDEILLNCAPTTGVDLELRITANPIDPKIYNNTTITLEVSNNGGEDATGLSVEFPIPYGYAFVNSNTSLGQYYTWPTGVWTIDLLPAGQSATVNLTIFALTEESTPVFAQITTQDQDDQDSQPNNNDCLATLPNCSAIEDDEALLFLNGNNTPPQLPDLTLGSLSGPNIGEPGGTYFFSFTLLNESPGIDPQDFITTAFLSTDVLCDTSDLEVGQLLTNGTPTDSLPGLIIQVDIPAGQAPGDYFILLKTDSGEVIVEVNEKNNSLTIPIEIAIPISPNCVGDTIIDTQAEMDAFGPCVVYDGTIDIGGEVSDLTPMSGLKEVNGRLSIGFAPNLNQLNGLEELEKVNGFFIIANIEGLSDLSGLGSLSEVKERVVIINNPNLLSLQGLENLAQAKGIQVSDNTNLGTISSLQNIVNLSGELQIFNNPTLENLNGLEQLEQVGNLLVLDNNDNLEDLTALQSLTKVEGTLVILRNEILSSLDGLQNLNSLAFLNINNNPALSECCAIRNLLSTPGAISSGLIIEDNPAFCSSAQDILDNCQTTGPDLELSIESNTPDYGPWQIISFTVEVTNTGASPATEVVIDFPLPYGTVFAGGNEYNASQGSYAPYGDRKWDVGTLDLGTTALITFNLFTSQVNFLQAYTEVWDMGEQDVDSSPANGTCVYNDPADCPTNEDDEAVKVLMTTNNRQAAEISELAAPAIRRLAPNPASDQMELVIESPLVGDFVLDIYNSTGQKERQEKIHLALGANFVQLSVAELPAGTYFLVLVDGHRRSKITHFVKVRQ